MIKALKGRVLRDDGKAIRPTKSREHECIGANDHLILHNCLKNYDFRFSVAVLAKFLRFWQMFLLQKCMFLALFLLKIYVNLIQFEIMQPSVTSLTALVLTGPMHRQCLKLKSLLS